ncbi:capsid protein [Sewage-associated circular DNA virus-33]|uniref:capsid protein n=1 Tax=Sewage-associated circular DNA virus-33 TaxID=1592100 RepID=UPI000585CFD1|nr:capsid protein [Sewage-associated circular DNA virus-33]AJD07561.1 capsid protein [Sewage-associated circular DNA virus-33]
MANRAKSVPRTPMSLQRGRSRSRSMRTVSMRSATRSASRRVLSRIGSSVLGRVNPYVGTALSLAPYARAGLRTLRSIRKYSKKNYKRGRKSGGRKGAAFSKSAGFFGGTLKDSKLAPYLSKGVVQQYELGDVVSEASRQVVVVGHSTCPPSRIIYACFGSLLKLLFRKAGIKIKNWEEPILEGANIPARIAIRYKERDGYVVTTHEFPITTSLTMGQLVLNMVLWINGFSAINFPGQFLSIQYYHDVGTLGSSRLIAYDIDMTSTTVQIYCRSNMKIQNRTINTSGNDQDSDVDNVPLYGKHFTVKYNGTVYRDYNTPAVSGTPQLYTDPEFGSLNWSALPSDTGTSLYKEVPEKSQFIGVKSAGPAHLDPGEVKTSKLEFSKSLNFNKLMMLFKAKAPGGGGFPRGVPFYFGETRFFCFEKMINAVAMTAENAFKLAFEIDLTVGAICSTYENHQTAKLTFQQTGQL